MSVKAMNNFQFAPLRSLDDVLLEPARYQKPVFGDAMKWGKQVVMNLLYYQTNYFILATIELIIIGFVQPKKIVLGIVALAAFIYAMLIIYGPNKLACTQQLQKVNRYVVISVLFGIVSFFLYMYDAALLVAFTVVLLIIVVFIHSSLRMRSIKNKISTAVESYSDKLSPMGQFLEAWGIIPEPLI